jgi:hypothetical protein
MSIVPTYGFVNTIKQSGWIPFPEYPALGYDRNEGISIPPSLIFL